MADPDSIDENRASQMSPDELTDLARRLRTHAASILNPAAKATWGDDMLAAAAVIDGIISLYQDVQSSDSENALRAILRLFPAREAQAVEEPNASGERDLKVIFSREGVPEERHIVRDGDQALKVALHLITGEDALRAGDALTVVWHHRPGLVERRLA